MKLLDKTFERALLAARPTIEKIIDASRSMAELGQSGLALAQSVQRLALSLAALAEQQAHHAHALHYLNHVQQQIMKKMSLDTELPEIEEAPRPDEKDKAAIERAKAAHKPN